MADKKTERSRKKKLETVTVPKAEEKKTSLQAEAARRKYKMFSLLLLALILVALVSYSWKVKAPSETKEGTVADSPIGKEGGAVTSIKAPPRITSIKLSPPSPVKGDRIKAEVTAQGREGHAVSLRCQWSVNGVLQSETSDIFTGDFKKGDNISLTVTPYDEKGKGEQFSVSTLVFNSPPGIISTIQDSSAVNGEFNYQIKATDPDDDILKYSLKSAPEGMTIDPQAGLIKWSIPSGYKGKVFVYLAVSDVTGGEATQIFNLQIDR